MDSEPDDDFDSGSVSSHEAFLAMADFLWAYARRIRENDLYTLLGDLEIRGNGSPTDPAAWTDWLESVRWIKAGKLPRTDV